MEALKYLSLISQVGFTMVTPILLCTFLCMKLEERFHFPFTLIFMLIGVISGISGFFNTVISVFMAVVFAIYILVDKERIAVQGDKLLRAFLPSKRDTVSDVLSIFNKSCRKIGRANE